MRNWRIHITLGLLCCALACSSRDFLTRHLAADLIFASDSFKAPQKFWLRLGTTSNQDYLSPEYLVLQRRGWITAANVPCPPGIDPPPCWDVALTPLGVGAFHDLIAPHEEHAQYFSVPVARRQLVEVTGIAKANGMADVDFQWKWSPLNEVGQALYTGGLRYKSTVSLRHYDDGWRLVEGEQPKPNQALDEALKNSQPVQ